MATTTTLQARMNNPALVVPGAMDALQALSKAEQRSGVPEQTLELVHLRASQINGCGFCVDMHSRALKKLGASDERVFGVAAWRESPYFSDAERAALALTEAATRISDREDPVPDELWAEVNRHYDEQALAGLIIGIAAINTWNRLNVPVRTVAGSYPV
jgi:AhpD family alkylhydroperoxidase